MVVTNLKCRIIGLGCFLVIAACSVVGDRQEVSVKHSAEQQIIGQWAAEKHCAQFGKTAKLLKTSPTSTEISSLFFRTKTSVYACITDAEK